MGKALRYIVVAALAVCYFIPKPDCLYSMQFPAHLLHHFFHANVFHFAVNAIAVWAALDPRMKPTWWSLPTAFCIGSVSYFFASSPVIGFSNVLFAMAGMRTPSFRSRWWRTTNAKVFLASMLLMVFLPHFSAVTHFVSFSIGVLVAIVVRFNRELDYDTRRAAGNI